MRIDGEWYPCDDGIVRPVFHGHVQAADRSWKPVSFLVDTGADQTVFSADVLARLACPAVRTDHRLAGVGGVADSVAVPTQIRFACDGGRRAVFRGEYAAFTSLEALDMSILGRDVMSLLTLIVDWHGDVVCMIAQEHRYRIEAAS